MHKLTSALQEHHAFIGVPPELPMVPLRPSRSSTIEGFVWALVILGAVRLGRKQAEDTFLDYDSIRVKLYDACQRMHHLSCCCSESLHGFSRHACSAYFRLDNLLTINAFHTFWSLSHCIHWATWPCFGTLSVVQACIAGTGLTFSAPTMKQIMHHTLDLV